MRDSHNHGRSSMEVGMQDWNMKYKTGNKTKREEKNDRRNKEITIWMNLLIISVFIEYALILVYL